MSHAMGTKYMANKFSEIRKWLQENDWTLDPVTDKWENYELREKQIWIRAGRLQQNKAGSSEDM